MIGFVAVGAVTFLPSRLRAGIERAGGRFLGREVRIAGTFDLSLSLTPTLLAEDVTLANAPWGSEPSMVRIARVKVSLDLLSLRGRPARITDLELEGVRILLETDAGGGGNWEFETRLPPAPPRAPGVSTPPPVVFDHAVIRGLELIHRPRRDAPPLRLGIARLEARVDPPTGMVDLDAAGHFNDAPWDVAGRVGTYEHLCQFRDVEHTLTGRIGNAKVTLRGRIRDPLSLGEPNLETELEGPDIAAALAVVGLRSPLSGPFRLQGRTSPSRKGIDFDLTAGLAGVAATARGHVGALLKPEAIEARIEVSGPDARLPGKWTGVGNLPPRPFALSGRVRRDGPRLWIDDAKVRVGGTSVAVKGALGEPPRCVGADLAVTASGTDLSELSALAHLRLPTGEFAARGRFLRRADALAVEDVEIRAGDVVVQGGGTIGEPPRLDNLDMTLTASGPDLSQFTGIVTIALPRESYSLRGRVARRGAALELDGLEGRLGDNSVSLDGSLVPAPRLAGSEIHARITGPDLGKAASLAGLHGLPAEPYDVSGRVRFAPDGYQLEGVEVHAGGMTARLEGHLGARPAEDGTTLDARIGGPALSDLAAWGVPAGLPGDPFTVSGRLRIDGRVWRVDRVMAEVGADRASLDGTLGPLPDLSPLDVGVEGSGPRLADLGRFPAAAGAVPAKRLPAEPYAFSARVRRVPAGFELREARVTVGNAEVRLDGVLGSGGNLRGTDVRFEARAPDATVAEKLAGMTLPPGPVDLRGRVERVDSGFRLDGVAASVGEARVEISGRLGEAPALAGTDLDLRVAGPDLAAALGPLTGISPLPAQRFEASAHLQGSADRFSSERFVARLGESDVEGTVSVRLEGRPFVEAELRSRHLGFPELLRGFPGEPPAAAAAPGPGMPPSRKGEHLIPDRPLALDALRSLDGRIRLAVAEMAIPGTLLHDVAVEGELRDGSLRVTRIEGSGAHGGRADGKLSLEPLGDGYRLRASGALTGGRIVSPAMPEAVDQTPSLDVEFEVEGSGRSIHDIAAGSSGHALLTLGPGRVPSNLSDFVTSSVARGLLDALNPFRKSSPETVVECGIVVAGVENGKMAVEPIAMVTDKLTIIGRGKIDLETEKIELVWTLKPRKGVGISASSIANPYIKLGGTLSSPSLEAKPLQAAASTGAAVATAGLTILFRGVYDRITAEKKVCVKALEEARRQAEARETGKGP